MEGRQDLAVVESSSASDEVVGGSAHHRGLHGHRLLVFARCVLHVCPDPQRSSVVRSKIVTSDHLHTVLLVVGLGGFTSIIESPLNRLVVNLSASVSLLIGNIELSVCVSSCLLECLTGNELGLDLGGSDGVETRIELVELAVNALRDSGGLNGTLLGSVTSAVDVRQVNGVGRIDAVEVVVVLNSDLVGEVSSHNLEGVSLYPW